MAASGNIYVADTSNQTVRKITTAGVVSTLAGSAGTNGFANGTGTAALFNGPFSVAVDSSENVYVADLYNFVVRAITPAGVVTTPYGQAGVPGRVDGIGPAALFNAPVGVAIDSSNNLYITDSQIPPAAATGSSWVPTSSGNNLLRRATPAGVVSTIAGAGSTGSANGTGTAAQFFSLQAVAVNSSGVVYLADTFNQTIRVGGITPVITTQLGSQTVPVGQAVTFSVTATGPGTLSYQWYKNGTAINGATAASYTINSPTTNDATSYWVTVTDSFGTSTSTTFNLTVTQPVPALPRWGLVCLPLLLVIVGAHFLRKRFPVAL